MTTTSVFSQTLFTTECFYILHKTYGYPTFPKLIVYFKTEEQFIPLDQAISAPKQMYERNIIVVNTVITHYFIRILRKKMQLEDDRASGGEGAVGTDIKGWIRKKIF